MKGTRIWFFALLIMIIVLVGCSSGTSTESPTHYTVGIIALHAPLDALTDSFKDTLATYGYVEDDNLTYVSTRAMDGRIDSIIAAHPDVVLCVTTPACELVQNHPEAGDLPVVFVAEIDPVLAGYADSWSRPGGHFTGISVFPQEAHAEGRRLQYLLEIDPTIHQIYVPYNTTEVAAPIKLTAIQDAAETLGVELVLAPFETETEGQDLVGDIPEDIDAIFTFSEKIYAVENAYLIANVAIMHKLPYSGATVETGALMSYGPNYVSTGQQAARLAAQILKGAKVGELPIEVPEFVLSINLKTARYIGIEVPDSILRRAQYIVR